MNIISQGYLVKLYFIKEITYSIQNQRSWVCEANINLREVYINFSYYYTITYSRHFSVYIRTRMSISRDLFASN